MARPDVEVYRQPHTDRWIAQCWEPECKWQYGNSVKTDVRQHAAWHRQEHRGQAKAEAERAL